MSGDTQFRERAFVSNRRVMRRGSADDCESNIGGQAIEISPADMFTARVGIDGLALGKAKFIENSNTGSLFQPFIVQKPRQRWISIFTPTRATHRQLRPWLPPLVAVHVATTP